MQRNSWIRFRVENVQYDDFRKGLPEAHVWEDRPLPRTPIEVQLYVLASEVAFVGSTGRSSSREGSTTFIVLPDPICRAVGEKTKTSKYWDRDLSKQVTEHLIEGIAPIVLHDREEGSPPHLAELDGSDLEVIGTLRGNISWYDGKIFSPTRGLIVSVHEIAAPGSPGLVSAIMTMQLSARVTPARKITWESPPEGRAPK